MKKYLFIALTFGIAACSKGPTQVAITSPDNQVALEFILKDEKAGYLVKYKGEEQIKESYFAFDFLGQPQLAAGLELVKQETSEFNETWEMPWGEQREVVNHYNQLKVTLKESQGLGRTFNIVFRAFNEGVGFRFEFPEQDGLGEVTLVDEHTQFNLTGDHKVWWQPGDWDIYEYVYQTTPFSKINARKYFIEGDHLGQTFVPENAVNTPVTMKTASGIYLAFHEADLTNYSDMTLKVDTTSLTMVSELVGNMEGFKAKLKTPFVTPWRTIQMSDRAGALIESRLIENLNEPNELGDISDWFQPMKYVGIWWEMHLNKSSWDLASGKHGATTKNAKRYIDFAAKNGIKGLLVEGWNTGWETWTDPNMRDTIFDFVTPYKDYDLKEVVRYAKSKGVEVIMHHETSAAVQRYEQQMDTAYQLMKDLGIHAVKTGYVGSITPKGEYHHGQWMVNHFQRVLNYGAGYQVAINMHEPIKATGKRRTYPNAISREAARGQEYNAWSADGGNPPEHLPIIAFTRMLAGPFDFTPGVFNISLKPYKPDNQINTTLAQQLAAYVVIYSPIQMACDLPEHYEGQPAFQFIRDVAVDWEQTKVLDGEPGDYVVIARQERGGPDWFVGGLADENGKDYTLALDFLEEGKTYTAKIYQDTPDSHYKTNPTAIAISEQQVQKGATLPVNMMPGGGFAVSLMAK
ncbi:MAG: glycoside hydrolase family 97 protein [Cyclobacteriaceae bacterium]